MTSIYDAYAPSEQDIQEKRSQLFGQAVQVFTGECEAKFASSADDVDLPLNPAINPHIWDVVRSNLPAFEASTLLTIHEGKLMTLVRKEKLLLEVKDNEATLDK